MMVREFLLKAGFDPDKSFGKWKEEFPEVKPLGNWQYHLVSPIIVHPDLPELSFQLSPLEAPDFPPKSATARISVINDARKNHSFILEKLESLLGKGKETSLANTVAHSWYGDHLELRLTTWPPELNQYGQPDVPYFTTLELTNNLKPKIDEDKLLSLSQNAKALHLGITVVENESAKSTQYIDLRFTRWNLAALPRTGEILLFRGPEIGVISRNITLKFPTSLVRHVVLQRAEPARGSGYSRITLLVESDSQKKQIPLIYGHRTEDCDLNAPVLAEYWNLPLLKEEFHDD